MLFVTLLPRILNFVDTAGIGKELNSFAQWERDRYLPGASCAHGRLEVWNLLATRCSPLWTEFFERDDPIKISGFGKKYANRGPALNYLKLPRENSMPSNSFLFFFFFTSLYFTRVPLRKFVEEPFSCPLISSIRLRFFGQDSRDFLIVHGGKLSCEELIKK